MSNPDHEPLRDIDSATIWFLDDHDAESTVRSEDAHVEIYPNWVRIRDPTSTWVPRELVEKVSEL